MSYNNYVDAAAARRAAFDFAQPCVAIIKHSNPCGIAVGADPADAHRKAHACDPESAFGGVIAVNAAVTAELAGQIAGVFTEVVVAPGFEPEALEILAGRKNLRLLRCPAPARRRAPNGAGSTAASCSSHPTFSTPPATTPPAGSWWPATRPPPTCLPISHSPGGPAVR